MPDNTTITVPRQLAEHLKRQARERGLTLVAYLKSLSRWDEIPIDAIVELNGEQTLLAVEIAGQRFNPQPLASVREFADHVQRIATNGGALFDADIGITVSRKG